MGTPRTAVGAHVAPPADGPANASPDDPHDQLLDASLLPSQLLTIEVLRQPVESAQYTSLAFGRRLRGAGLVASMGSAGDCFDNAVTESFFATLGCELLHRYRFGTRTKARALAILVAAIFDPALERPTSGIWAWSLVGVGVASTLVLRAEQPGPWRTAVRLRRAARILAGRQASVRLPHLPPTRSA